MSRVLIGNYSAHLLIEISPEDLPAFQKLISRGLNTWDHAPASIKTLGDMITSGKVLQDYHSQDSSAADALSKKTT